MTIDLHVDLPHVLRKNNWQMSPDFQTTPSKMQKGSLDKVIAALYLPDSVQAALGEEDSWRLIEKQAKTLESLIVPYSIALEGARLLGSKISSRLEWLQLRGCRYITLTHNRDNQFIGSATDSAGGLTKTGRLLLKWMEELKIIPDISHCSDLGTWSVLCQTKGPVIASHSGAKSIYWHPRNLSNDLIVEIAERGGIIGVPFASNFVIDQKTMIRTIDHIVQLLGHPRSVAIGSDLDGAATVISDASEWNFWQKPLRNLGYSEESIDGIGGGNYRRMINDYSGSSE